MNSLYPILRKVLVQVTKIATTVLLLIVLIDYFEKLIAFKFESVYEGTDGYTIFILLYHLPLQSIFKSHSLLLYSYSFLVFH